MNSTIVARGRLLVFGLCCSLLSLVGTARAVSFSEFIDPHPAANNQFGATVVALSTGNVVITSPGDDAGAADAGAVYLFNGATGALISTLRGSTAGDQIGNGGVTALSGGNYVISSRLWDNGGAADAGAATWGHGTTGVSGVVSAANSLVGSTANDQVSSRGVLALTNGNYVVMNPLWDNAGILNAGSATWGNGNTGVIGVVSPANSLVGSKAQDGVSERAFALTNGNYVVTSFRWDNAAVVNAGAATWGNGTTGITGAVSVVNSLIGSANNHNVGGDGVLALTNGNYVVLSSGWDNGVTQDVGASTWGAGTTGITGFVGPANSQIGSLASDGDEMTGLALTNGNYVVRRPLWDNGGNADAGAVSWGNGSTGTIGIVAAANSLIGSTLNDRVGEPGVTALTNGNYVVASSRWNNGAIADAGAATWGNGATGVSGSISAANSLVGGSTDDRIGSGGNTGTLALSNGHYVVLSSTWDNGATPDVGAATWGNGSTGIVGLVSGANSLIGATAFDNVGNSEALALTNGHYVVFAPFWDNGATPDVGAATWCNGTLATSAIVSAANSLIGSSNGDNVGTQRGIALTNGNYVVQSGSWDDAVNGWVDAGAATWCSGAAATSVVIDPTNSLIGRTNFDNVGGAGKALSNGNYVISSPQWDNAGFLDPGAATWGNGTTGSFGLVKVANSLVGLADQAGLGPIIEEPVNGFFIAPFVLENGGKVRVRNSQANSVGVDGPGRVTAIRFLPPAPNPSIGGSRFAAVFPARDRVSLVLVDVHGRAVRTLAKDQEVLAGEWSIAWDACDGAGRPVPAGVYFLRLTTRSAAITHRLSIVR